MVPSLWALFQHNQLVQGGLLLGALGGLLAYLRNVPLALYRNIKNRLLYTITVTSNEAAYEWLEFWLCQQFESKPKTRSFRLSTWYEDGVYHIALLPAPGEYMVRYKGKLMWLSMHRERLDKASYSLLFLNTIVIRMFRGQRELLAELVREAKLAHANRFAGKLRIYTEDVQEGGWQTQVAKYGRPLDSVILANGTAPALVAEVKQFFEDKAWYQERGIPWRRGYLLYGEPGNGKTSLIQAVATAVKRDIAVLSLSNWLLDDKQLNRLLSSPPANSIICIEDIDAAFNKRQKLGESKLSFSGLLNALDGISSSEERVLFMTTNFKEHLDPALIRPGRADKHIYIGNATKDQARRLFLRFYHNEDVLAERFACQYKDASKSMAALQEYFLCHLTAASAVGNACDAGQRLAK